MMYIYEYSYNSVLNACLNLASVFYANTNYFGLHGSKSGIFNLERNITQKNLVHFVTNLQKFTENRKVTKVHKSETNNHNKITENRKNHQKSQKP